MELIGTPNRSATTQWPSSCRSTHAKRRRMKSRVVTPARGPDSLEALRNRKARRIRKVKWIRMGIPSTVPSRNDPLTTGP
jgi:hypothetical protein